MSWPTADAPQFRSRLLRTNWQRMFAAAIFAVNVYVAWPLLLRLWGPAGILASLVIAGLMTWFIVLLQFVASPALKRTLTPLPFGKLLGLPNGSASGQPLYGEHALDAFRRHLAAMGNELPRGDEERRRALLIGLQERVRRSLPPGPDDARKLFADMSAALEREPLPVLQATAASLRPEDDLAYFLHSWAAVPSTYKLDFLTFRSIFDGERLDATTGSTAGAAAGVLRSVHVALHLRPGQSLTNEGVDRYSEERIIELLRVAYGAYLLTARTLWGMMSNAQRRAAISRAVYTQITSMSMTSPLASVTLNHAGKSAAILKYMERRDVYPEKVNIASLEKYLARQSA